MKQIRILEIVVCAWCLAIALPAGRALPQDGSDWTTWASTYTHDLRSGARVDQYALPREPMGPARDAVQRSGYRHYRSTLQTGLSNDNVHIVEQWGQQVQPYEQWRFPYRPYGVPYDAWGPPLPYGLYSGFNPGFGGPWPGGVTPYSGHPGYGAARPGGARIPAPRGDAIYPGGVYPGQVAPLRWDRLQPQYRGQPWYDGTYPAAPPLDPRSDQEFFYHPPLGRSPSPTGS